MASIYRLQGKTQSYDWGKLGADSKVATYASASGADVDDDQPYAELWMGTHPNGPSIVLDEEQKTLRDLIQENDQLSGLDIYQQYQGDLPFLFKILSIRKALSIQAHPDKELGAYLHTQFPHLYKDPNHKPEMAIALTPFEAFCGFRPLEEIAHHLTIYPELAELVGEELSQEFTKNALENGASDDDEQVAHNKELLKSIFSALMHSPEDRVQELLSQLVTRLNEADEKDIISELIIRLDLQYPGDVGVFSSLFLNYVTLEPGQAIFLGANEPHAYLSGDCIECMATSDNVVRAGLTPKFKDVDVLVDMLTYRYGSAEAQKMSPEQFSDHSLLYDPPIEEFGVIFSNIESGQIEHHKPLDGPSILIVTKGNGQFGSGEETHELDEGYIYFVGANTPIAIRAGSSDIELYRAYSVPQH
ncbi:phosphomannose isomerase type I [Pilobolus umbonatus]|nr:phosphomannose isomerase type I [Pilobolus umbonatus]